MVYNFQQYTMAPTTATASVTLPVIQIRAKVVDPGSGTTVADLTADAACVNLPADLALLSVDQLTALLSPVAETLLLLKAGLS